MSFEDEQLLWAGKYRRRKHDLDDDDDSHDLRADAKRSEERGRIWSDSVDDEPDLSPDGNTLPKRYFRR